MFIWTIAVFIAGMWVENKFKPRVTIENNHLVFKYKNKMKAIVTKNIF